MKKSINKKTDERIIFIIYYGKILYSGSVYDLPIKEKEVIAGSIAFYNDPEPCMIHRSAVISRYYIQIDRWLDEIEYENTFIDYCKIPLKLCKLLDINIKDKSAI